MAYELTITPNRGYVILDFNSFQSKGNVMPNSISGNKIINENFNQYWTSDVAEFIVKNTADDASANFNNSLLSNTTQIILNGISGGNTVFMSDVYNYVTFWRGSNFGEYVLYKINSSSNDYNTGQGFMNVTYIDSNIDSFSSNEAIIFRRSITAVESPFNYLALPTQALTVIGNLKSINAILQSPETVKWYEIPNSYNTFLQNGGFMGVDSVLNTVNNTSDVILTYEVTKNGIPHQSIEMILQYQA